MLHPESPNPPLWGSDTGDPAWPDGDDVCRDRRHRDLCGEILAQMAAGGAAPYPFGDALYLVDALGHRAPPARHGGLRRRMARLATLWLTWARRAHRMEQPNGEGSFGGGQSWAADLPLRGLRP